jgi:Tol biopolymer transport system component
LSTYWKPADGSGEAEPLLTPGTADAPFSWSPDGRVLAVDSAHDIWVLPVEGDRTASPFLVTQFNTKSPRFSPDGCFIAYASDESGRDEVYVQPYPGPGEKVAISTGGGRGPVWSADGRELFFRSGDQMMAADVKTDPTFTVGKPRRLFEGHYVVEPARHTNYDVAADGQRFVMIQVDEESAPTQINVVLNWFEELKRLVPTEN